jgi:hypothetical protein
MTKVSPSVDASVPPRCGDADTRPDNPRPVAVFEGDDLADFLYNLQALLQGVRYHARAIEHGDVDDRGDGAHMCGRALWDIEKRLERLALVAADCKLSTWHPGIARDLAELLGVAHEAAGGGQ